MFPTKINLIARLAILSLLSSVLMIACGPTPKQNSAEIEKYISAHTSGVISTDNEIRVVFSELFTHSADYSTNLGKHTIKFDPHIEGQYYWINKHILAFKPDNDFEYSTRYTATLDLGSICDVDKEIGKFYFEFQTRVLDFNVNTGDLTPYPGQSEYYKLTGNLNFSDVVDQEQAIKVLKASQDGEELPISWNILKNNSLYVFTVDSILRSEQEGELLLAWDGSVAGVEKVGELKEIIPASDDFDLLNVRVYQLPSQRLVLSFSDRLKEDQHLEGLVQIDGSDDLKISVKGNMLEVYTDHLHQGMADLSILPGIQSITGTKIDKRIDRKVNFTRLKPQVSLINNGVILPSSQGLILPFKAVGLNKVDVRVIKIFENNIPQFLQVNKINNDNELRRVGRPVLEHTIDLASTGLDMNTWNVFSLDLSELIHPDPGAIYNIEFLFYKKYSAYECTGNAAESEEPELEEDSWDFEESSYWDTPGYYYWGYWPDDYDWSERDNPCHNSYYISSRFVETNILATDLGVIVKSGASGKMMTIVTNLVSTDPISGAVVDVYNYQLQKIGSATTNAEGMAEFSADGSPFILIASKGDQNAYLRIDDGSSLSLSDFNVSGVKVNKGIRGFLYGERGVWRPGDTLFLNFILDERGRDIPDEHPLVFELLNPHGRLVKRMVKTSSEGNIYKLETSTSADAPTGSWTARVKIGGATFTKPIRIETVKPNRLKIKMDLGDTPLVGGEEEKASLQVNWLHGAPGRELRAQVDMTIYNRRMSFDMYPEYSFFDASRIFYPYESTVFDGRVDAKGNATIVFTPPVFNKAPGMLQAGFTTRAFEEGGDFSTDVFTMKYAPYDTFIGIKTPVGDKRGMLLTDTIHSVKVITCNAKGEPVSTKGLKAAIYKVNWRWWWNSGDDDMASYFGSSYKQAITEADISTAKSGKGEFKFKIEYPDWGRYYIKIWDPEGGASTGKTVYIDWPGWAGQAKREFPGAASLLTFTSDKDKYRVGETAEIIFPSSGQGRALVSIESGSEIVNANWVLPDSGQTKYNFEITPEMAPNVYVHITIVQPHNQSVNDAPMRLYGIIPILVEDPDTRINPVLEMADELEPEKPVHLEVYEENGMPMTYTIAMVDEGLLDLTRFKTPDPWKHFYAREALGVKTWDIYNWVIGAYGGKLEQVFGIGGGMEEEEVKDMKANRFKPVVKFLGPFTLDKGESAKHEFLMPNYVGSVRTMVVAAGDMSYGSVEKTTPVKKPLMLLATLPRVLGPGEKVDLPVTVFAMDKTIKEVELKITSNSMFEEGSLIKTVSFEDVGDQVIYFSLNTIARIGIGNVMIEASSGKHTASTDIEIEVRNPNPPVTNVFRAKVDAGQEISFDKPLPGISGSNSATLEVASLMPIDLERRLRYLIAYPHGCLEQTVSRSFPQLYLADLTELTEGQKYKITENIRLALEKLIRFQSNSGGMRLWPSGYVSDWTTSYAGHFFIEAEKQGYALPVGLKSNWLVYQQERASEWKLDERYRDHNTLDQAYRLYTLALAGSPDLRAMNRLRETRELVETAKWYLISTYIIAGQPEAADQLAEDAGFIVPEYEAFDPTYGSYMRDRAIMLQSILLLGKEDNAYLLAQDISEALSRKYWMSTHTTAYCLMAMSEYYKGRSSSSKGTMFSYTVNGGKPENLASDFYLSKLDLDTKGSERAVLGFKNEDDKELFVTLTLRGNPLIDSTENVDRSIEMKVVYRDMQGSLIDPDTLVQGTDFVAEVRLNGTASYTSYRDMALTQVFPSGWEIINKRMHEIPESLSESPYEYRDIRDDRVMTYFNLYNKNHVKYTVLLNAAYVGRYYLPGAQCEAMYNPDVYARRSGKWVEVIKAE